MPRTEPSRADGELMARAAASGYPRSAHQLERWRGSGLIPRPQILRTGGRGTQAVYPPGTADLVCVLARHAGPGRSYDDLALLAFFDGADVPEIAVKTALAKRYFGDRFKQEDRVAQVAAQVPPGWAQETSPEYEQAEAAAKLELASNSRAVRQMRINLRRLPDLARASRTEVDGRLLGVLVGLDRLRLPEEDRPFMADLTAALHLGCDLPEDCLAVWEYAAISHVSQMASYRETSPEERLDELINIDMGELRRLRDDVRVHFDQMWERATWGRQSQPAMDEPWLVRGAGTALVEWISARQVHPPGSVLARLYYLDSLADLSLRCWISAARGESRCVAGEGRAAFIARTGQGRTAAPAGRP